MSLTGKDLIELGFKPGPHFSEIIAQTEGLERNEALEAAHAFMEGRKAQEDAEAARRAAMEIPLQDGIDFVVNVRPENEAERKNLDMVLEGFRDLVRTPTVIAGAVMPDTCPTGTKGEIPVGGVIGAKGAIHPGMHSADICCSMFVTKVAGRDPGRLLDDGASVTHFGPGGRSDGRFEPPDWLMKEFSENVYLCSPKILHAARTHFGTQGDGNHFFYTGSDDAGNGVIVTHHGSRGVGALLYKAGMVTAERYRVEISPETAPHNAWIPLDSLDGRDYWRALQLVREWTRMSHMAIHDATLEASGAQIADRFWNEHNFVFQEDDVIWHAKGATPIHQGFLPDTDGRQIIPLNMTQPVLIVTGQRNARNLGFAPHGAGRNMSRSAHRKTYPADMPDEEIVRLETQGIDARFFAPDVDVTELPSAYKDAGSVRRDIEAFGLCEMVEEIAPHGCIMGGDFERNAPWKVKQREREAERARAAELEREPEEDSGPGF